MEKWSSPWSLRDSGGVDIARKCHHAARGSERCCAGLAVPNRTLRQWQVQANASIPRRHEVRLLSSHVFNRLPLIISVSFLLFTLQRPYARLVQQKLRTHLSAISFEDQKVLWTLHRGTWNESIIASSQNGVGAQCSQTHTHTLSKPSTPSTRDPRYYIFNAICTRDC